MYDENENENEAQEFPYCIRLNKCLSRENSLGGRRRVERGKKENHHIFKKFFTVWKRRKWNGNEESEAID